MPAAFTILIESNRWLVLSGNPDTPPAEVTIEPSRSLAEAAAELAAMLNTAGHRGEPVVLALSTANCLAATISTDGLPRRDRRKAMIYRLEEQLPIDAEQYTAGFVESASTALGVASPLSQLEPLLKALESCGLLVQAIVPAPLLIAQHLRSAATEPPDSIAIAIADTIDWITLTENRPIRWRSSPSARAHLDLRIEAAARHEPIRLLNCGNANVETFRGHPDVAAAQHIDTDPMRLLSEAGAKLLAGELEPWIDLQHAAMPASDPMRPLRRPLIAAVTALALLLVSISGMMLWRAQQYRALANDLQLRGHELFHAVLPHQQPPPTLASIHARLQSELRKAQMLQSSPAAAPSALATLYRTLHAFPANLRVRVTDFRIDRDRLTLQGEARTYADADTLAAALRTQADLDTDPPQTQQLREGGVGFVLHAKTSSARSRLAGGAP